MRIRILVTLLALSPAALAAQARDSVPARELSLDEAIAMAQRQGLPARAAQSTRDAVRARNSLFGARLMPQLTLGGNAPAYSRAITPVVQPDGTTLFKPVQTTDAALSATISQKLPFTGGTLSLTSSLDRFQVTGAQNVQTWTSNPFVISLQQDLLRPNAIRWDSREQDLQLDFAERQYLEAREDIATQTANAWFSVYAARMALDNATANAATNDTLYTLNKGRYEVGKIGENDLLQSELALLRARSTLDGAKLDFERAVGQLRIAVNLPTGTPLALGAPAEIPGIDPDTAIAVREALRNRSQQTSLAILDLRARRELSEAKLNNGMGASVTASLGFNSTAGDMNAAYRDLLQAQRFQLGVQIPLVQWGARGAAIEAAEADRRNAEANAANAREQTAQDAKFAALQLSQTRRNVALSAKADTVAIKRFEVAYNRYVIGKIGIDNLYIAQNEKDQALQQYVQALRGYWMAYYALRKITLYDFRAGGRIQ